jgi:hypothetical protein
MEATTDILEMNAQEYFDTCNMAVWDALVKTASALGAWGRVTYLLGRPVLEKLRELGVFGK